MGLLPVYSPALTGTHWAYLLTDSQAELICMAGYLSKWFTHLHMVTIPVLTEPKVEQLW